MDGELSPLAVFRSRSKSVSSSLVSSTCFVEVFIVDYFLETTDFELILLDLSGLARAVNGTTDFVPPPALRVDVFTGLKMLYYVVPRCVFIGASFVADSFLSVN